MLKSVLSSEDCASCRFCCSFRRKSLWETPLFDRKTKEILEKKYPDSRFKKVGNESFTVELLHLYKSDDPEEEAACPFLGEAGCILSKEEKTFTIITLGDSGVGKTSIINRYTKDCFDENSASTLGMSFSFKEIVFNNKDKIKLKFVDTAGQEKYKSLAKSYLKNVDEVLFVFSMNNKETFKTINNWMELFRNNNNREDKIPKYLVGTKNDLEIKVEQSLIDDFAQKFNIPFISTSAKKNNNIDKLFDEIGETLYNNYKNKGDKGQNNIKIKIAKNNQKKCCHSDL